jgi:DNA-binding transcriptional LysR family regulator
MQIKQLEVLEQVARLHSFSRAADALYLTQPTVSAHLAGLEQELGAQLVVRSTKQLRLTPAGEIMARYAGEILGLCRQAQQEVQLACSRVAGTLSVAASTVPSQYLLPRALPALGERYPQVFFQIRQGDSDQVAGWMLEGGADLGIVGSPVRRPGLVCTPFLTERLAIVTPNTPEYRALNGTMPLEVLRAAPFLVREPGSGTRKRAEAFLRDIGLEPQHLHTAAQLDSTESILQGVRHGLGISILSGIAAADAAAAGHVLAFDYDSPALERQFYLLYHKTRPLSPAAAMLLEELPRFFQVTPA